MITFKDFLTESRSAPLYHATKLHHANKILEDDILYASEQYNGATVGQKVIFFTRSFKHALHVYGYSDMVIFEFDQQKLNQRYKISPIKNHAGRRTTNHKPMYMNDDMGTGLGGNEFEEIVKRNITQVNDYITKIYITRYAKGLLDKYPMVATDDRLKFL